jgi:HEAT repeat protein
MGILDIFRSEAKKAASQGKALRSGTLKARRKAVQSLARIKNPAAAALLIQALSDEDDFVRMVAMGALEGARDPEWVEALLSGLKTGDAQVRSKVAAALGEIKDPRGAEALLQALDDEDRKVRGAASWALGQLGDPRAAGPLMGLLKDENSSVRIKAAHALGQLLDNGALKASDPVMEGAIPALIEGLKDNHTYDAVGDILRRLGLKAVPELLAALKSEDLELYNAAAWVIGHKFGVPEGEMEEALREALRPGAEYLMAIVEQAEMLDGPKSLSKYVARAVNTLGYLREPAAAPVLEHLLARVQAKEEKPPAESNRGEANLMAGSGGKEVEVSFIKSALDNIKGVAK